MADASASAFEPEQNFGGDLTLEVKHNTGSPVFHRKVYMQFDASACVDLSAATLELEQAVGAGEDAVGIHVFSVYGLETGESWAETGITWNNAPENVIGSGNAFGSGMTKLGEFSINGNGTPGSIVSCSDPRIAEFLNAETGTATIAIARDTLVDVAGRVHHFHSREASTGAGPRLLVAGCGGVVAVEEPVSESSWGRVKALY